MMLCDELKDYDIMDIEAMDDERLEKSESGKIQVTRVYIKSEADKVIADLEESHKKEVGQLLIEIAELKAKLDNLRYTVAKIRRDRIRQKYKRCMNNAWWCYREEFYAEDCHCERWVDWAIKWFKRWLAIAEKFKEAK